MKLRNRLFLWVGLLFFIAFALSLYIENVLADKDLQVAEAKLKQQILQLNEEKRIHFENYLKEMLSGDQAQVDALLWRMAGNPQLADQLFLTPKRFQELIWSNVSFLLLGNKWIDFVQTTKNGLLSSLLIPLKSPLKTARRIPIDKDISWIVLEEDFDQIYLGIKYYSNLPNQQNPEIPQLIDQLESTHSELEVLFEPSTVSMFSNIQINSLKFVPTSFGPDFFLFLDALKRAAVYLNGKLSKQWMEKQIRDHFLAPSNTVYGTNPLYECVKEARVPVNNQTIQLMQRGEQLTMISKIIEVMKAGIFGNSPFDPNAPKGIIRFTDGYALGDVLLSADVFFPKSLFESSAYFAGLDQSHSCKDIAPAFAVIASEELERVFLGNVLQLRSDSERDSQGFLTLGIDVGVVAEQLVLNTNQMILIAHQGKIFTGFDENHKKISGIQKEFFLSHQMRSSRSGVVSWKERPYYYLQMTPFPELDLHFYILSLEKDAFQLINALDQQSRQTIKDISWKMRLISLFALAGVLVVLHSLSRKITKPITHLAKVTQDVVEGRLEDIVIPKGAEHSKDEISELCNAFEQMIQGLKEKEKVKGILNKVVSQEIAEEFLKGEIHLGGEEKIVTVLFADIRNFTRMSGKMQPQAVIEMLNRCMTKVSQVIDEYGGVIDKYVGDEVMALFGAPVHKEESALKAVKSALKIIEVLNEWNIEREHNQLERVEMGIGIHTGNVLVGNMGAENRLNYTVIGSNVNLAARLCSAAKGMQVLISKDTYEKPLVKAQAIVEPLPPMELKGFEQKIPVFWVKGLKI